MDKFIFEQLKKMFPYAKIKADKDEGTFKIMERVGTPETLLKVKKIGFSHVKNAETIRKTPFIWCCL